MRKKKQKYRDYSIRPNGSFEVPYDINILERLLGGKEHVEENREVTEESKARMFKAARFVIKVALKYLPPKQRRIFYSVWCRSDGKRSRGILDFSRRLGQSHFTNYINYRKAMENLKFIMDRSGYGKFVIMYIRGAE